MSFTFRYELTTSAAPDQTVAYLADLSNMQHWLREVSGARRVDDSRYDVEFPRFLASNLVFEYQVTSEPGSVVAAARHRKMDVTDRWDITAGDDGSVVRYTGVAHYHGITPDALLGLVGRLRSRGLAKALKRELDAVAMA